MSIIDPELNPGKIEDYRQFFALARRTGSGEDFQCNTRAGKITAWMDERPQPTYAEINAVELGTFEEDEEDRAVAARLDNDELLAALAELVPGGKAAVLAAAKSRRSSIARRTGR